MNFLLHRHLAVAELSTASSDTGAAGIGAMLPDLWRMADRRMRARPGLEPPADANPELRALLDGIEHHLQTDRDFHQSPVFREGEARGLELFRNAKLQTPKMLLFAHPAWELCLDGALLLHTGLEPTLSSFRRHLQALDPVALGRAADLHRPAASPSEGAALAERLGELLHSIAAGEWIAGYRTTAGLAARLGGLRRRLGLPPQDAADRARLESALEPLLELAHQRLPEVLAAADEDRALSPAP